MDRHDFMNGSKTSRNGLAPSARGSGRNGCPIDAALFAGQVIFATDECGTYIGSEVVGTAEDAGTFTGNAMILLEDGSVSTQTFEGRVETAVGSDRLAGTGTWRMESATGRFAGLRNSGTFRWWMTGDDYQEEFTGQAC